MWPLVSSSQKLARQHVSERDYLIEKASHVDEYKDLQSAVLSSDIVGLVDGIKSGKWTSTIIVSIFIHAAIRAHHLTNCLTEVNFEFALQRAAELDAAFAKTGELVGPLHGLPFSLKDQFDLKSKKTSIGYTDWIRRDAATEDCAIARIAQHHGAIPLAKTNVPQTMLSYECNNPLWGRTLNPYSKTHTSGGSSGGECALLACDGAAFGFGSDIGGSLRIPVHYCGVYAIKPSAGRSFPEGGSLDLSENAHPLDVVLAPITRNVADLQLLTTLFYNTLNPPVDGVISVRDVQRRFGALSRVETPLRPAWFDPVQAAAARSPLRQKLRVGYYKCDGMTKTSPACVRAVEMARAALQGIKNSSGMPVIEMVEIDPKLLQTARALQIFVGVTSASGYDYLRKHLKSDWADPSLWLIMLPAMSRLMRWLVTFVARFIFRDGIMAGISRAIGPKHTRGYFSWRREMLEVNNDFDKHIWHGLDLDAIICPVQAIPAITHRGSMMLSPLAAATILYNIVDCCATVVPVTRVDPILDAADRRSPTFTQWKGTKGFETCSKMLTNETYKGIYDAKRMAGLPVGVQIVTARGEEEKSIGMLKLLDEALGERGFGPGQFEQHRK